MESSLGQRRFVLRLLTLLHGDQAREIEGAMVAIGRRLTNALAYGGRTESIVRLEEPETLDGELLKEEESEAKAEAEKARPGLVVCADGSRVGDEAAGCAVVWKDGLSLAGINPARVTIMRPTMRSAPVSPQHWNQL